jgi:hypothetical protein
MDAAVVILRATNDLDGAALTRRGEVPRFAQDDGVEIILEAPLTLRHG